MRAHGDGGGEQGGRQGRQPCWPLLLFLTLALVDVVLKQRKGKAAHRLEQKKAVGAQLAVASHLAFSIASTDIKIEAGTSNTNS